MVLASWENNKNLKRQIPKVSERIQQQGGSRKNEPSTEKTPSVSFEGTGEDLNKQHVNYMLLIFVCVTYMPNH